MLLSACSLLKWAEAHATSPPGLWIRSRVGLGPPSETHPRSDAETLRDLTPQFAKSLRRRLRRQCRRNWCTGHAHPLDNARRRNWCAQELLVGETQLAGVEVNPLAAIDHREEREELRLVFACCSNKSTDLFECAHREGGGDDRHDQRVGCTKNGLGNCGHTGWAVDQDRDRTRRPTAAASWRASFSVSRSLPGRDRGGGRRSQPAGETNCRTRSPGRTAEGPPIDRGVFPRRPGDAVARAGNSWWRPGDRGPTGGCGFPTSQRRGRG